MKAKRYYRIGRDESETWNGEGKGLGWERFGRWSRKEKKEESDVWDSGGRCLKGKKNEKCW